ncbi:hypothetical protein RVF83_08700 [Gordonia rubripertincta]|uniref:DUF485 domain-containing protein n=2 Tax=Gordonia rubripertincta TaxID=36822 RepID=A0AAW4G4S6_GORRU|nr:hypothetical protein [Gordonia rubripertincta]MBM7278113.1 hypothetical protein [Gordonia rubripertincta]MDG6781046.1 hypothetical protein [Gordonia rubripertincta]NKY62469.1 hypothetical protein [Gordonia rubripertincta]QMU22390.1 hypothetical protein H3V45_07915 [Gordonia rubripertincta]TSD94197.1 hypothetical protein FOV72_17975 [Gordonia rubripertincta]
MSENPPQRERVVLASRRGARMVRTRVEVQEQTEVGDALVRGLMRAQLGLALRLGGSLLVVVVAIPLLAVLFPSVAETTVLGIRITWLVLGLLAYPVLYLTGLLYVRLAEHAERDFMSLVDDDPGDPGGT